jgi:hypothetical protein
MPLIELQGGFDRLLGRSIAYTAGGAHLRLSLKNSFTFAATLIGGNTTFPFFADTVLAKRHIIPEFGQAYGNNQKGYQFFDYTGYLSYTTRNRVFNLQAGRDKHFIGDGYRSLLLSDYAPAYPYFRINTNIWNLQYSVWYAWMLDASTISGRVRNYGNKYGAFHYLSWNALKELNIGLFENVIWRGSDTSQARTFDINYLNPVVFYRPQEYSVGSPDNSFLGMNVNATLFKKIRLYAQLGLDEFYLKEIRARKGWWANKQAWQLGLKYINVFGLKGLSLQCEYNQVRPYTYSHGLPEQNYSHYGMPLAHPLGANFREWQFIFNYRNDRSSFFVQIMTASIGDDTTSTSPSMGQDIFRSYISRPYEYGHYTGQGIHHQKTQTHIKYSYLLVPRINLRIEAGYIQRIEDTTPGYVLQNPYFYAGLRTNFWNSYRDQ